MSKSVAKRIENLFNKADTLAQAELERLALKVMRRNPCFTEFVCAMGSATFTREYTITGKEYVRPHEDHRLREVANWLDMWDDTFHLTGTPVRLKPDGTRITDW